MCSSIRQAHLPSTFLGAVAESDESPVCEYDAATGAAPPKGACRGPMARALARNHQLDGQVPSWNSGCAVDQVPLGETGCGECVPGTAAWWLITGEPEWARSWAQTCTEKRRVVGPEVVLECVGQTQAQRFTACRVDQVCSSEARCVDASQVATFGAPCVDDDSCGELACLRGRCMTCHADDVAAWTGPLAAAARCTDGVFAVDSGETFGFGSASLAILLAIVALARKMVLDCITPVRRAMRRRRARRLRSDAL